MFYRNCKVVLLAYLYFMKFIVINLARVSFVKVLENTRRFLYASVLTLNSSVTSSSSSSSSSSSPCSSSGTFVTKFTTQVNEACVNTHYLMTFCTGLAKC